jgi:hypothetical protein
MEKTVQQEETTLQTEPEEQQIQLELPEEEKEETIEVEESKEDVKDEEKTEVEEYSDTVQKRINKLTYKLREQERQSEEALAYAKRINSENESLKSKLKTSDEAMFSEYGNRVKSDLDIAKQEYKDAYDSGNTDSMIEANEKISKLTVESESLRRVANQKKASAAAEAVVPEPGIGAETMAQPAPEPHPKAQDWAKKNEWFGEDQPMTFAAFGIHKELVEEGYVGTSDDYYDQLDKRLYKTFPNKFNSGEDTSSDRPVQTVASPTRQTKSKNARSKIVKLTQSQVAVAKKLGVPLEEYAKHVKE